MNRIRSLDHGQGRELGSSGIDVAYDMCVIRFATPLRILVPSLTANACPQSDWLVAQ
jgi:hypothetical protein